METLVLDVGYQPIATVPWEKAIVWYLERVVEIVDSHPDKYVRTVSWSVQMPSIVRFLKPYHKKKAIKFSRHNVYARDKFKCQYCGHVVPRHETTYDHVVPRAQGGRTTWENVVIACVPCNQKKANRTPQQAHMLLLSTPVKPKSLPNTSSFAMRYQAGMPESWKQWLRSELYWRGTLDE